MNISKTNKIAKPNTLLVNMSVVSLAIALCGGILITASEAAAMISPKNTGQYSTERTGIQAFTGGDSVNVRWNFNESINKVEGYIIYRNDKKIGASLPGKTVNFVDKQGTRYNDTKIKANTSYKYQVEAIYKTGKRKKFKPTVTVKTPTNTTPVPSINIDTSGAKDLDSWARKTVAPELKTWYPKISDAIAYPDYKPPTKFTIKFSKDGLAVTSGNTITLSAKHFREHKDDVGTVVHEMTHVIQGFSGASKIPTWLMEGMADYGRNVIYADKPVIAKTKHYYTDSYQPTAAFLDWIERNYEKGYVRRVNIMGHNRQTTDSKLKFKNGKNFDQAWADMLNVPVRKGKGDD